MKFIAFLFLLCLYAHAGTYQLVNGTTVSGEPFSYNASGLVLRTTNGLSQRIPWTNFSKDSLEALAQETKDTNKAVFVKNAINPPPPPTNTAPQPLPPEPDKLSIESVRKDPVKIGLVILAVAALLFLLKLIGKLFTRKKPTPTEAPLIKMPVVEDAPPGSIVYRKPDHRFNRRFFEMNLSPFMRIAQEETDEPKNVIIKSARGTFMGRRITNLNDNDLTLQRIKGFATSDEVIPFDEIREVQIVPEKQ